jgi:hypothetical protein
MQRSPEVERHSVCRKCDCEEKRQEENGLTDQIICEVAPSHDREERRIEEKEHTCRVGWPPMFSHFGYETASNQCLVNNVDDIARKNGPEQK